MTTLTLNKTLLELLCAVKAKQKLAIIESSIFEEKSDWMKELRNYFNALPDDKMKEAGLVKNEYCIRAIESFTIPDEWMSTTFDELGQFTFSF